MIADSFRSNREPWIAPGQFELHARDMTATFSAEVPLHEAQRALGEVNQWLPIDGNADAPLGQLIDRNSTGPLRLGYGAWRDLLLGIQFENGRGELITAGGRVVKNVAGYDLTKFLVGSAGIFGRIKALTVRTWRRPAGVIRAIHAPDVRILNRLMPGPLKPQWAMLSRNEMQLGYLGDEPTLQYYRDHVKQSEPREIIEQSFVHDVAHRAAVWSASGETIFRASIPPVRLNELPASLPDIEWIADAAFGIVIGSAPADRSVISGTFAKLSGTVSFWKGNETPAPLLDVSTNPIERQIIERLKVAFDPESKLNPLPWSIR